METDYKIIFSRRKTLMLTVERDRSIVVTAPLGTSQEAIHQAVESRKLWLYEKTRHAQKNFLPPHPPGKEMVSGESVSYLGRYYRIEFTDSDDEIRFEQKFIVPRMLVNKTKAFQAWFIKKAKTKILPRVPVHAKRLGVIYKEAKLSKGKYRWGSCTPHDNVLINWRLIKAPLFVIDYVIVHELAHLIESNHSAPFWNIVRAQITNTDKAKAWLLKNGALLQQDF